MPTVPTYDVPLVQPEGLPGVRQSVPASAGQLSDLGRAAMSAGSAIERMVVDEQQKANMVRVDDALNKTKLLISDATYDPQSGYLAKRGQDAFPQDKPLDAVYGEKVQQGVQQIADSLGNEEQKREYIRHANAALTDFRVGIQRHSAQEFQRFGMATNQATIEVSTDSAARAWNNPEAIRSNLDAAHEAVLKDAKLQGVPEDSPLVKQRVMDVESAVHTAVIKSALENDQPDYAGLYFRVNSDGMTAKDILSVRGAIIRQQEARTATVIASDVMSRAAPKMVPDDLSRFHGITWGTESGGQQFDEKGNTITSPKGAVGKAQVMPTTGPEAAKLAGLPWDEKRLRTDAAYNEALGTAYLNEQLKRFGGDPAKAWAAYNAGPGALDKALAAAAKDGTPWLSHMPKETQDYVTKNMQALDSGQGRPQRPTLQSLHAEALAALPADASPTLRKLVTDQVSKAYEDQTKAIEQAGQEAVSAAQQWFIANPGTSIADMPPSIKSAVADAAPGKMDDLVSFAKALNNPERKTDLSVYNAFIANMGAVAQMPTDKFMHLVTTKFSESDGKAMIKARQDYLNGGTSEDQLNYTVMNRAIDSRLSGLEVNVRPKADDNKANAYLGGVRKFVADDLYALQSQLGRKLTPEEITKRIDQLFVTSVDFRKTFMGVPYGRESESILSPDFSVPKDQAAQIRQYLIDHGNKVPTETDVLNAYRRLHAYR
jgi:soluble lytic murein transglycosylase